MQLHIIAVGLRMPDWVTTAVQEYCKRMPPEMRIVIKEVKPEVRSANRPAEGVMHIEAERIRASLPKRATMVILDEHGADITTLAFASHLEQWRNSGNDVAFIIGGADGLDARLKAEAALKLRLSSLTLPHAMVRVLLTEQLYRAWTVTQHHPYHRN